MIGRTFLSLALFGVIVLGICHGKELNSNEAEAWTFLNQTSEKSFSFFDGIANRAFAALDDNYDYEQAEARRNYSIFWKAVFEDARKFDFKNFKDEELKFAFEKLIEGAHIYIVGEDRYMNINNILEKLNHISHTKNIDAFDNSSNKLSYSPDIGNIQRTSNDPEELKYYWSAWKKTTGEWAKDNLDTILETIKQAADLRDVSPLEFWSRGFNITDMEQLMSDFRPLHLELHAFVRSQLRKKYGESIIAPNGLIPDYLYRQITFQLATDDSIIEEMFPYENLPQPEVQGYKARLLHKIAENFFANLGFNKYPNRVWLDQIKLNDGDEDNCEARVWYWTPTVYLDYCNKMSFRDFLKAYSNMANLYHAKEMVGLPSYYFEYPNSLDDGVSRAVVLSASTHHSLEAIGMLPDFFKSTEEVEMNRLLRKAIRRIMIWYLPFDFVHAKVMADLLSGNITMAELNKHYWKLMEKYAGVGPPKDHDILDTYDLPMNFYEEMVDNDMSSDFTMEVLSYKIYLRLCELSGLYPKDPLHLCDISGSKEAGNALKKMMKLGASKPFYEVLATMFPEDPTVSADGLLEYYYPLQEWLAARNKESYEKLGWEKFY